MKIALLAPFEEAVPPKKYGGTERVVYNLAQELIALGHDVTLFASADSKIKNVRLIPGVPKAIRMLRSAQNPHTRTALNSEGLANVLPTLQNERFDIVHNHIGWPAFLFKDFIKSPIITTLHGNLAQEDSALKRYYDNERYMYNKYKDMPYVSISNAQRRNEPQLNYIATVYNGIQVETVRYNKTPKDYLMFLGRIHPHKGPEYAIEIAKKTKQKLIIAAKIDPAERDYFKQVIKPHIDGKQIVFIAEPPDRTKFALLQGARAIISPIQWDEPFGLVNIEALASGTPVITIKRGSTAEIIINGKVGYLCKDVKEMARRVKDIDKISRLACRRHVEENFSAKKMAEEYLVAYKKVINQSVKSL